MKLPTREQLVKRRQIVIADAQMKLECADWHGLQDCGSDLREIDAKIAMLDEMRQAARDNRGFQSAFEEAFGANSLA